MAASPQSAGTSSGGSSAFSLNPWVQLVAGIICMAMIANYQYGWTVFVNPLAKHFQWSVAAIQWSFAIFVIVETWLVPFEAALVDRYGPRLMVAIGGVLAGLAWVVDAKTTTLAGLYFGAVLAGIGAGIVYGTCIGNALKWFAGRRGLAAGLTSAGFGAGAALTVVPISLMVRDSGFAHAFMFFGIVQGIVILIASQALAAPPKGTVIEHKPVKVMHSNQDSPPPQTLRSPTFWVMYVMFVLVATGGLVAVAQLGPIAKDFHISKVPVTLLAWTLPALTFALALNNIMNGITRPLLGFISDRVGRENTMFWAFLAEGLGIFALSKWGGVSATVFVLLAGLVFFAWGEIFSIFPSTTRDHFGMKYATTNYGMLYTAKGTAALLIPFASVLTLATGSWTATLIIAGALNIVAALLALFVLKPVRRAELSAKGALVEAAP